MGSNSGKQVRAHVFVSGRVQGVFFRDHTRRKAEELAITGWVANNPDGRVEAVFEGAKENVEKMLDWAKQGPDSANVDKLDMNPPRPKRAGYPATSGIRPGSFGGLPAGRQALIPAL